MALIICPECNGKVSDQATSCPHCGFPFNNNLNTQKNENICLINNKEIDLSEVIQCALSAQPLLKAVATTRNLTDCTMAEARDLCDIIKATGKIPATFTMEKDPTPRDKPFDISGGENNQIKCPKCGSTAVTAGQRGFNILTGFIGSGATVNRCAKCGYKWKP